jgi:acyl carrier protein phosphodiesterase
MDAMNYLAHIYLADLTGTSMVGNFLGDFVKGPLQDIEVNSAFIEGINLHRKIDVFTDSHQAVAQSRQRISKSRRRFAGIIIDIAYDHCLASNWQNHSSRPLADFVQNFYQALQQSQPPIPQTSETIVAHLIQGNWLENYQSLNGVAFALDGISRRIKARYNRDNPLQGSVSEIQSNLTELQRDFDEFFPELIQYATIAADEFRRAR